MAADPLVGYRVLGFDLETTGFSPKQHRIVQYALIGCDADGSSMHLEELVNPQMRIPMEPHGFMESLTAMSKTSPHSGNISQKSLRPWRVL